MTDGAVTREVTKLTDRVTRAGGEEVCAGAPGSPQRHRCDVEKSI
jgi:hypothetical protein